MDRRSFLVAVGLTMAGCGGSQQGGTPSDPTATDTATPPITPTPTPVDFHQQFREQLETRNFNVDYFATEGLRGKLDYYIDEDDPVIIRESIQPVAEAFTTPIVNGWSVEGLDVRVLSAGLDESIATYRIEAIWAKQYHEDTIDWGTYRRKIRETLNIDQSILSTTTPTGTPADTTPDFDLGAIDSMPTDPDVSLNIDYNYDVQQTVDVNPDDDVTQEAPSSNKYLAVQVVVRNLSDSPVVFYPGAVDFRLPDGEIVPFRRFKNEENPLWGARIQGGDDIEGGIPYLLFHTVSEGDLVFDPSLFTYEVSCTFDRDRNLQITI